LWPFSPRGKHAPRDLGSISWDWADGVSGGLLEDGLEVWRSREEDRVGRASLWAKKGCGPWATPSANIDMFIGCLIYINYQMCSIWELRGWHGHSKKLGIIFLGRSGEWLHGRPIEERFGGL
jgi:hypothetical protein